MSDYDRMVLFGQWLTERAVAHRAMLIQMCSNVNTPVEQIRLKYGHLEAFQEALNAFTELYKSTDVDEFKKEYLDDTSKEQDNEPEPEL